MSYDNLIKDIQKRVSDNELDNSINAKEQLLLIVADFGKLLKYVDSTTVSPSTIERLIGSIQFNLIVLSKQLKVDYKGSLKVAGNIKIFKGGNTPTYEDYIYYVSFKSRQSTKGMNESSMPLDMMSKDIPLRVLSSLGSLSTKVTDSTFKDYDLHYIHCIGLLQYDLIKLTETILGLDYLDTLDHVAEQRLY